MLHQDHVRPIFICGSERSGTTMLRLMLHAHPRIAIPPQTKYARKLYKRRLLFGNLIWERNRTKLAEWFVNHFDGSTKLHDLGIDPQAVRDKVTASESLGAALSVPWILYADKHGKPRWGDKRPYYIHHMTKLRKLYPDGQIIHVIRDCRDVVASLKTMPWWRRSVNFSILNWKSAIRHGTEARQNTKLDEYIEIRYEDLLAEPERELHRVCQFLGEIYDPAMLKFQEIARTAVPEYKMAWHSATREPINETSVGRWEKDLSPEEISLIEIAAGEEMVQLGYSLSGVSEPNARLRREFSNAANEFTRLRRRVERVDSIVSSLYTGALDYREG